MTRWFVGLATVAIVISLAKTESAVDLPKDPRWGETVARGVLQPGRARVHEDNLRKMAISKPSPVYPKALLPKKLRGLVVAEVETDADGKIAKVSILESPDPEFSKEVSTTLQKWAWPRPITPPDRVVPTFVIGRLTFYFDVVDGKGVVKQPGETPKRPVPGNSSPQTPPAW